MITYHDISAVEADDVDEPVGITDVKTWARIDSDEDDSLISGIITGARQDIENWTNLALVPKSVTVYYETTKDTEIVRLPYSFTTATIISVNGSTETAQTVDEDYYVRSGNVLPINAGLYKASYTAGISVPQALKEAVKMLATYRYNNRGDEGNQQGIPADIISKINPYKIAWL